VIPDQPLPRRTKVFYALGTLVLGARDTGFNTFILIFYNQALGVPAALAGLALMISLIADAVFDPLIGLASDGWRSRWGRRHPFIYTAALPAAVAFFFLWSPPDGLGPSGLFWCLLGLSILTRFLISLFEVPFTALVPEFTADYDERTTLMSLMFAIGWWAGLSLAVLTYAVLLRPTAADPSGMMNREGFAAFGVAGSILIVVGSLAAGLGTHEEIERLAQRPWNRLAGTRDPRVLMRLLSNGSVLALLASVILMSTATGFGNGLYNYIQVFFWKLSAPQIGILSLAPFASAGLALVAAPWISRGRDKRNVAIGIALVAVIGQPLPMILRLAGWFPRPGDPLLLPILAFHSAFETTVWVLFSIVGSSMVADLVEDEQRRSGARAEGALFALRIFAQKAVSGLGVLLSGLVLAGVGFPTGAHVQVSETALRGLGFAYAPIYIALGVAAALAMLGYRITRQAHVRNLSAVLAGARDPSFAPGE
jgi:Na+/melibiose symporter-like transporter